ncbi:MAG: 30S ribosomal protein S16 [Candidatus Roizmanbacteria bacterium]|uniref:Small ribosomal subunit protein bS16 n=1 Tax=Candidatus Roizmanbacteria bacterium CG10_big_fil_rev_8_21_14_0_10_39_12 TaxID=1974852 RepID=A0A2M8KN83_9BACT|nr:30S ribosomal protein S16 [Candidatus Roizmanbacteria bacterium]PJE61370.1 MAG: 30S ribosomal protein S16 [Candidatus Roizmanbacteria bacterium CG10_big_fil_rev_8_21_14_0_10_39_12]
MSATIRLMRFGKRKQPFYRIVVLDKRKKRDGAYIERVGTYNPLLEGQNIEIVKERFESWRQKGAQISDGLKKLLSDQKRILYS